jgi:hypothetical protein
MDNYIVDKRYRLQLGMTIGAVGYNANFEYLCRFIKIFEYCNFAKTKIK